MKPSECLAKDTNGEESKTKQEKEQVKGKSKSKEGSENFKLQQCILNPKSNQNMYANSPGLSGSLLDTTTIPRSPVRVTKSPG